MLKWMVFHCHLSFQMFVDIIQLEPRKKTLTFHSTGCFIGILSMVYHNPTKLCSIIPYIPQTTSFFHCFTSLHTWWPHKFKTFFSLWQIHRWMVRSWWTNTCCSQAYTLPETNEWWFPIGISFSRGLFSGAMSAMVVLGRVHIPRYGDEEPWR